MSRALKIKHGISTTVTGAVTAVNVTVAGTYAVAPTISFSVESCD